MVRSRDKSISGMGVKDQMAKLKANLNIIASALLLMCLITTPAIVGYVHDFLSSLTHQAIITYVEDKHITRLEFQSYNGTWLSPERQSWTYDPDNKTIIVPSISYTVASNAEKTSLTIKLNYTYFTGAWLWDQKVEHIIIALSCSANLSTIDIYLRVYAPDGSFDYKCFDIAKSGYDITIDITLSYTMRAWFSTYTGHSGNGDGMVFVIDFSNPNLNGEYLMIKAYFTRSERSWVAGISDAVLAGIGVLMIIAAVFATPYVSLKDIAKLGSKARRRGET